MEALNADFCHETPGRPGVSRIVLGITLFGCV